MDTPSKFAASPSMETSAFTPEIPVRNNTALAKREGDFIPDP
jgi:hypothetical protein